jgi:hypothetical protein
MAVLPLLIGVEFASKYKESDLGLCFRFAYTMFNPALDDQQGVVRLVDMYPQLFRANPLTDYAFFLR